MTTYEAAGSHATVMRSVPNLGLFAGFGTLARKEAREWLRGLRAPVVALVAIALAALGVLAARITLVLLDAGLLTAADMGGVTVSTDPTMNILASWAGANPPILVLLATAALVTGERDRGTLAWSISKPLSRAAFLAAKCLVAFGFCAVAVVFLPLTVQIVLATLAYGALPDLAVVLPFGVLYLGQIAFYCALSVALGSCIRSTVAVAGIGIAAVLVAIPLGALLPAVHDWLPTSLEAWAGLVATNQPAPLATPIVWAASMVGLAVLAAASFARRDL